MTRAEIILRHINKNGQGIEIGPSYNPIAPKKAGFNVSIIDHVSREELVAKYTGHNVNVDNIEEVDFVWQGEKYSELTGKNKYYDWIVASHVIEHTPDLVGFLNNCDAILKDDGVISLAVPDKRYCFDRLRPITGLAKIIDSHYQNATIHSPGTIAEYYLNIVSKAGNITWNINTPGEYQFLSTQGDAIAKMKEVVKENTYIDAHNWCFVPHSFRLIIHDLFNFGLIPFQEVDFIPTGAFEFFITLSRRGKGINKSRVEMLQIIESEVKEESKNTAARVNSNAASVASSVGNRVIPNSNPPVTPARKHSRPKSEPAEFWQLRNGERFVAQVDTRSLAYAVENHDIDLVLRWFAQIEKFNFNMRFYYDNDNLFVDAVKERKLLDANKQIVNFTLPSELQQKIESLVC